MSINRRVLGIGLALVLCQPAVVFRAQGRAGNLEKVKTLKCTFPLMALGTWSKTGEPEGEVKASKLQLGFENIEAEDGTADVIGSFGAPHIVVRYVGGYLHFMQVGSAGFLYTTTVYDKAVSPGKLIAMHSRHEYTAVSLPGYTSSPEQYYGVCEVGS